MKESSILKRLVIAYIYLFPFHVAFAVHKWLPPSLLILIISLIFLILIGKFNLIFYLKGDLPLKLFLISIYFSLIINANDLVQKNINHGIAIFIVLFFYYFLTKKLILFVGTKVVDRHLYIPFCVIALYGVVQYIDVNWLNLDIDAYVYFPSDIETNYGSVIGLFARARSIFVEPGYFAWYLNAAGLLLISIGIDTYSRKKFYFLLTLYCVSLILTFSVAGILFSLVGLVVSAILIYLNGILDSKNADFTTGKGWFGFKIALSIFLLVSFILIYFNEYSGDIMADMGAKLLLEEGSGEDRSSRWSKAITVFYDNPFFGIGLGSTSAREAGFGVTSFYLTVLSEAGVITFVFLVLFFLSKIKNALELPQIGQAANWLILASLLSSLMHFAVATNYDGTWVWFLLAYVSSKYDEGKIESKRLKQSLRLRSNPTSGRHSLIANRLDID